MLPGSAAADHLAMSRPARHPPAPPRSEVDHVITTKELAAMIQEAGIDFASLPGARARRGRAGGAGDEGIFL